MGRHKFAQITTCLAFISRIALALQIDSLAPRAVTPGQSVSMSWTAESGDVKVIDLWVFCNSGCTPAQTMVASGIPTNATHSTFTIPQIFAISPPKPGHCSCGVQVATHGVSPIQLVQTSVLMDVAAPPPPPPPPTPQQNPPPQTNNPTAAPTTSTTRQSPSPSLTTSESPQTGTSNTAVTGLPVEAGDTTALPGTGSDSQSLPGTSTLLSDSSPSQPLVPGKDTTLLSLLSGAGVTSGFTTTVSSISTSTTTASPTVTSGMSKKIAEIVGGVLGGLIFLLALGAIILCLRRRRRRSGKKSTSTVGLLDAFPYWPQQPDTGRTSTDVTPSEKEALSLKMRHEDEKNRTSRGASTFVGSPISNDSDAEWRQHMQVMTDRVLELEIMLYGGNQPPPPSYSASPGKSAS